MKAKRAPKRDLFAELSEGMTAMAALQQGKRTLRTQPSHDARREATPGFHETLICRQHPLV